MWHFLSWNFPYRPMKINLLFRDIESQEKFPVRLKDTVWTKAKYLSVAVPEVGRLGCLWVPLPRATSRCLGPPSRQGPQGSSLCYSPLPLFLPSQPHNFPRTRNETQQPLQKLDPSFQWKHNVSVNPESDKGEREERRTSKLELAGLMRENPGDLADFLSS